MEAPAVKAGSKKRGRSTKTRLGNRTLFLCSSLVAKPEDGALCVRCLRGKPGGRLHPWGVWVCPINGLTRSGLNRTFGLKLFGALKVQ